MSWQIIEHLSTENLLDYLAQLNIAIDPEQNDIEELQGMLASCADMIPDFPRALELSNAFENQPLELIRILLESNAGRLTEDLIEQLKELCCDPAKAARNIKSICVSRRSGLISVSTPDALSFTNNTASSSSVGASAAASGTGAYDKTQPATTVVVCELGVEEEEEEFEKGSSSSSSSSTNNSSCITRVFASCQSSVVSSGQHVASIGTNFGIYDIKVIARRVVRSTTITSMTFSSSVATATAAVAHAASTPLSCQKEQQQQEVIIHTDFRVVPAVYMYCIALDGMFDVLHWGWLTWTSQLEDSLLELLVSVDDDLTLVVSNFRSMMSSMGSMGSGADDIQQMLDTVKTDLRGALCDRSAYAVGRLHQTLAQFVEVATMFSIPHSFLHSLNSFISAKIASSDPKALSKALSLLVSAATAYTAEIASSNELTAEHQHFSTLIPKLQHFLSTFGPRIREYENYDASTCVLRGNAQIFPTVDRLPHATVEKAVNKSNCAVENNSQGSLASTTCGTAADTKSTSAVSCDVPTVATCVTTMCMSISWDELQVIENLRPKSMESMFSAHTSLQHWSGNSVTYLPVLPLEAITAESTAQLEGLIRQMNQTLYSEVINLGSMMGYTVTGSNTAITAAIITRLLDCGLCYVTSESGKLLATLASQRSMLLLQGLDLDIAHSPQGKTHETSGETLITSSDVLNYCRCYPTRYSMPLPLRKRHKDMGRIFRTKVKQTLSLRLNSNVPLAIELLRQHHGDDCWVGSALEKVWLLMAAAQPPQLLVFELWYGDRMIAADFGHPSMHGTCIYIATRFYDRGEDVRQVQPGFLLALLECRVLKDAGCMVWDLGGVNMCPLMRYKWDLTGEPIERMVAMHVLQRAQDTCLSRATPTIEVTDTINTTVAGTRSPLAHFKAGTVKEPVAPSDLL